MAKTQCSHSQRLTAVMASAFLEGAFRLAGVREPAALGKPPEAERVAWAKPWADAAALFAKAGGQPPR
jgi:hypothetical protein